MNANVVHGLRRLWTYLLFNINLKRGNEGFEEADCQTYTPVPPSAVPSPTTHPNLLALPLYPPWSWWDKVGPAVTSDGGGVGYGVEKKSKTSPWAKMACCLLIDGHLRDARGQAGGLCTLIGPQPQCRPQRDNMDVSISASRRRHVQQTHDVWVSFSMYMQAWYSKCKIWWCFKDAKEKVPRCVCMCVLSNGRWVND